jgi:hypothetical protein
MPNKNMHSDEIKPRRFAMQLYFAGDVRRYVSNNKGGQIGNYNIF